MTIVSNSEMEHYQKCERMFYYAHIADLMPKKMPVNIKRGSFGHKMLEKALDVIIEGGTVEQATEAAFAEFNHIVETDPDAKDMMSVFRHVNVFINYVMSEKCIWKPVGTEQAAMWDISEGRTFAFTPDLIVEFVRGPYRGQRAVLDYKFLGQFIKEKALEMSVQIPKYIIYRNKMHPEEKIHRGAFVQFNTRAQPGDPSNKIWLIKWLSPNKHELAEIEEENEILVNTISARKENPLSERFLRTTNKDVCNWCFFQEICLAERQGKPEATVARIREREFKPNEYGYGKKVREDV